MEKLVITVTVDSSMSYPGNPLMPPIEDVDAVAAVRGRRGRRLVWHLPPRVNWKLSVMDPMQWRLHALAVAMGGHVRVGWEDNPYLPHGSVAQSNAELVDVVVRMAAAVGRQVATPDEARRITGMSSRTAAVPAAS